MVQPSCCLDAFATISCQVAGVTQLLAFIVEGASAPFVVTMVFSHRPIFMGAFCARSNPEAAANTAPINIERIYSPRNGFDHRIECQQSSQGFPREARSFGGNFKVHVLTFCRCSTRSGRAP